MAIIRCPECNKKNASCAKKCRKCGYPFPIFVKCNDCEESIPEDSESCLHCGSLSIGEYQSPVSSIIEDVAWYIFACIVAMFIATICYGLKEVIFGME